MSGARSPRDPRFTPGTMLSERYRVVALLGSGGMGEVYRAEDTRLGQQVALKFLPSRLRASPEHLARLHAEVRLGRQVSHPNVCRVYDVGDWEGNTFLAMEYVDGEDLASLLRRIGKLPAQKALEIARDICAGVAAAHALGIVHRDLKPANIMIDGRGSARITDFGLAVVAEEMEAGTEIAGTPAYMAPEQLSGGAVTPRSDLFALGLVLYEIFTGRRLFEGADAASRRSAARTLAGGTASGELDPAIQRVIARCLEENPDARPSSIHAVIAALPGGDPLQAAVEAGETPSPQMVAAAGEVGDLPAPAAWALLAGGLAMLAVMLALFGRTALVSLVPMPKPPDALADRARTIAESAGYTAPVADSAVQFEADRQLLAYLRKDRSRDLWSALPTLRPSAYVFRYRQSPRALEPMNKKLRVRPEDPPLTVPGMVSVSLDTSGRLLEFTAVPPRKSEGRAGAPVDWTKFFEHAGGDLVGVREVAARWTAPTDTDRKQAWEATFRGDPSTPIRIEAASYDGKPVWFRVIAPWNSPDPPGETRVRRVYFAFFDVLVWLSLLLALVVARRNVRRDRGDRRGAARIAVFVFVTEAVASLFGADRFAPFGVGTAVALILAARVWVYYLAIEPYVRRKWPHVLIGWSRLSAGGYRDPMIGRDLLVGVVAGTTIMMLRMATIEAPAWFGQPKLPPHPEIESALAGWRFLVALFGERISAAVVAILFLLVILVLAYALFRRRWAAVAVVGAVLVLGVGQPRYEWLYEIPAGVLMAALFTFVLMRFGLLAAVILGVTHNFLQTVPFTIHPESWFFGQSVVVLGLLVAAMSYGFWSSLGGKKAFAGGALGDT